MLRAESFSANPGEGFSFTGDNGKEWKGTCHELRPIADGKFQFRGILTDGQEDLTNTEICGQYDPGTQTIDLIQ
jgi:hypothetical protein